MRTKETSPLWPTFAEFSAHCSILKYLGGYAANIGVKICLLNGNVDHHLTADKTLTSSYFGKPKLSRPSSDHRYHRRLGRIVVCLLCAFKRIKT
eukprot:3904843-Pyramimonas_sp.AAC.1